MKTYKNWYCREKTEIVFTRWSPLPVFVSILARTIYLKYWARTARYLGTWGGQINYVRDFFQRQNQSHLLNKSWSQTEFLQGRVNQALSDCNSDRKFREWDKLFQYFGHNYLLSRHSCDSEKSVGQKSQQIDVAIGMNLRRGESNGILKFGLWEGENMKTYCVAHLSVNPAQKWTFFEKLYNKNYFRFYLISELDSLFF